MSSRDIASKIPASACSVRAPDCALSLYTVTLSRSALSGPALALGTHVSRSSSQLQLAAVLYGFIPIALRQCAALVDRTLFKSAKSENEKTRNRSINPKHVYAIVTVHSRLSHPQSNQQ